MWFSFLLVALLVLFTPGKAADTCRADVIRGGLWDEAIDVERYLIVYPNRFCNAIAVEDRFRSTRFLLMTSNSCVNKDTIATAELHFGSFPYERFPTNRLRILLSVSPIEGDMTLLEVTDTTYILPCSACPQILFDTATTGARTATPYSPGATYFSLYGQYTTGNIQPSNPGEFAGRLISRKFRPADYYYKVNQQVGTLDSYSPGAGLLVFPNLLAGVASADESQPCVTGVGLYGRFSTFYPRIQHIINNTASGVCNARVSLANSAIAAAGNSGNFQVDVPANCRWAAAAENNHIRVTPQTGLGPAVLQYQVLSNTSADNRIGSLSVITEQRQVIHFMQKGTSSPAPFNDVPASHLFAEEIQYLKKRNVSAYGCPAGSFCPEDTITRGQMAEMIIRAIYGNAGAPQSTGPYFADVPAAHPAFGFVQQMKELAITDGCSATNFCPDDPVTRGQMAVFIVRAIQVKNGGKSRDAFSNNATPYFADTATTNIFFSSIQKMKELGVTSGCSATGYCGNDPNTRGQMAVFLARGMFSLWEGRSE